jgi:hypothetical protein
MFLRVLSIASVLAFTMSASFAQQPAAAADPASAAQECAKARHDHGADRGVPAAKSGCKPMAKKSKVATTDKKPVDGHDHGKMHKTQ